MLKKSNIFILLLIGLSTIIWQSPLAAMYNNLTPPQGRHSSPSSPENRVRTSLSAMRIFGFPRFSPSTPYPTPRSRQESPDGPDSPLFKFFKKFQQKESCDSATSDEEKTSDSEESQTADLIFTMDEDLLHQDATKKTTSHALEIPIESYQASLKRFNNPPKKD